MERLNNNQRYGVLVRLIDKLRQQGSWCGETHLQKSVYILQDLSKSELGYEFILYKHGPYSFDLKNEISAMRASGVIDLAFRQDNYGPSIVSTDFGEKVASGAHEIGELDKFIDWVSDWFGSKDVKQLEQLSTAYFFTRNCPDQTRVERATKITQVKPHIDLVSAENAVAAVEEKLQHAP